MRVLGIYIYIYIYIKMTRAKRRLLDRRMSLFAESKARGLGSHRGLKREALESLGGAPFLRLPLFQGTYEGSMEV